MYVHNNKYIYIVKLISNTSHATYECEAVNVVLDGEHVGCSSDVSPLIQECAREDLERPLRAGLNVTTLTRASKKGVRRIL